MSALVHAHIADFHENRTPPSPPVVATIEVVRVEFNRGIGCCEASLIRRVTAYYLPAGDLIAELDPCADAEPVA